MKRYLLTASLAALFSVASLAQDYDLTKIYLHNAGFDSHFDYTIDDTKLYKHPKDNYSPRSTEAETTRTGTEGPTTTYRNTGTQSTTGGYQGEEVLSREGQNLFNE